MWEKVVGPALEDINPALNPKNSAEVDLLLAAEIYMYVNPPQFSLSTRIICIMCIMCINLRNLRNVHNFTYFDCIC